jgi:hypothetical protein
MIKIKLFLFLMIFLPTSLYASDGILLSMDLIQNDQLVAKPSLLLPEAEEGRISSVDDQSRTLYAITASAKKDERNNITVKARIELLSEDSLTLVGEPTFYLKNGDTGSMIVEHSAFGKVELIINVNAGDPSQRIVL